jgi:hypothetical protein
MSAEPPCALPPRGLSCMRRFIVVLGCLLLAAFWCGCEPGVELDAANPKLAVTNQSPTQYGEPGGGSPTRRVRIELPQLASESGRNAPAETTVFNSFGPGDTCDLAVGWAVKGEAGGYRGQAEWFVPTTSGTLSSIAVAINPFRGSGHSHYSVARDNHGIPGTVLERFAETPNFGELNPAFTPLTLKSVQHPPLLRGVKYWLCAEPADRTTSNVWQYNNQDLASGFAFERSPWDWSFVERGPRNGAFKVMVVAEKAERE